MAFWTKTLTISACCALAIIVEQLVWDAAGGPRIPGWWDGAFGAFAGALAAQIAERASR